MTSMCCFAVLAQEDCIDKKGAPPEPYKVLTNQISSIIFGNLCQEMSPDRIPDWLQKDFKSLFLARENFYKAMLDVGNSADEASTTKEEKLKILTLAKIKATLEIKLFAKINNLEDVLDENSALKLRIIKFPGLPDQIKNFSNENSQLTSVNPFPGDADWAKFAIENNLLGSSLVEMYLQDSNGNLHKFKTYRSQAIAGTPGPKLSEGDFQVPEGEFSLDAPSTLSKRLFSIGINANPQNLPGKGSNIKIHGSGPSEGCVALSNPAIAELAGYMNAGKKSKNNPTVLVTPFDMKKDDYQKYYQKMSTPVQQNWSKALKENPYIKNNESLDDFWDALSAKNEVFIKCSQSVQTPCLAYDKYNLPDDSSCLDHSAFAILPYVSAQYLSLAAKSRSNFKEPKKIEPSKFTPNKKIENNDAKPIAEKPKPPILTCPEGQSLRWRVEYLVMGNGAAIGSIVISAKDDDDANAKAKKEFPKATKLTVKAFCMILTSSGY